VKNLYLFVLGRHPELSVAELRNFCDEVLFQKDQNLFLGENLKFENPRDLPKSPEQIFLDRLGGTIRMAKVIGEFHSKSELWEAITQEIATIPNDKHLPKIGFSVFGNEKLLGALIGQAKDYKTKLRLENFNGQNLNSGQIFERRILQKGAEFIIWQRGNSFLLSRTVANQNIRNYDLRDRRKPFRDAHMGMLPPRLAQILVNLAIHKTNRKDQSLTVYDPFCGSGTINSEAAIMGYQTIGSDLNPGFAHGAEQNFKFLSEKFRFESSQGTFSIQDAQTLETPTPGVIATEGWLGENFETTPATEEIEKNATAVLKLWESIFTHLENSPIKRICFCLPAWNHRRKKISIAEKLFAKIAKTAYIPQALCNGQKTFYYQRPDAFVAREVCVVEKQDIPG
jgi:tRNA G10  N-methylase Trm11